MQPAQVKGITRPDVWQRPVYRSRFFLIFYVFMLKRFLFSSLNRWIAICALFSAQTASAQTLPISKMYIGMYAISAEVAATQASRQTGLMYRTYMPNNQGMLFVFERHATHCFWMRNTLVPLTIAFLDDDGSIVNMIDMEPRSETNHCPVRPVRFALEMTQGWFQTRHIQVGQKIRGLPES
jgi:uncharacterized protein